MTPTIRPARYDDVEAVNAFTEDTWPEHGGDYVPRVFESWARENEAGAGAFTLVATDEDDVPIGLLRTVLLSQGEAWCGGLRVDPDHRGEGIAVALERAGFDWAGERDATVARAMVFGWNAAGLGVARAAGFEPATEFRWVHPDPTAGDPAAAIASPDPDAAWAFWRTSDARDHLGGLALDPTEPWALSTLTRERVAAAADEGRLVAVGDDELRGFAVRVRVAEYPGDHGGTERWAEYAVAAWTDAATAADLLDVVAADAANAGADRTRVLVPETVRAVSDVALARVEVADVPDFVLAAELTA